MQQRWRSEGGHTFVGQLRVRTLYGHRFIAAAVRHCAFIASGWLWPGQNDGGQNSDPSSGKKPGSVKHLDTLLSTCEFAADAAKGDSHRGDCLDAPRKEVHAKVLSKRVRDLLSGGA